MLSTFKQSEKERKRKKGRERREGERGRERRLGGTQWEKRSLSEFIKYQGKICGAGKARRAGGRAPLITSDSEAGTPRRCSWLQRRKGPDRIGRFCRTETRDEEARKRNQRALDLHYSHWPRFFHGKTSVLFQNNHGHVGANEPRWRVAKARSLRSQSVGLHVYSFVTGTVMSNQTRRLIGEEKTDRGSSRVLRSAVYET